MSIKAKRQVMGWTFVAAGVLSNQAPALWLLVGVSLVWSYLYAWDTA